jgi:hypothetical protein
MGILMAQSMAKVPLDGLTAVGILMAVLAMAKASAHTLTAMGILMAVLAMAKVSLDGKTAVAILRATRCLLRGDPIDSRLPPAMSTRSPARRHLGMWPLENDRRSHHVHLQGCRKAYAYLNYRPLSDGCSSRSASRHAL